VLALSAAPANLASAVPNSFDCIVDIAWDNSGCHRRRGQSHQLRRLRELGGIKRVTGAHRYYMTKAGRAATAAGARLTQAIVIPIT
jgi:hypothetical protein